MFRNIKKFTSKYTSIVYFVFLKIYTFLIIAHICNLRNIIGSLRVKICLFIFYRVNVFADFDEFYYYMKYDNIIFEESITN